METIIEALPLKTALLFPQKTDGRAALHQRVHISLSRRRPQKLLQHPVQGNDAGDRRPVPRWGISVR